MLTIKQKSVDKYQTNILQNLSIGALSLMSRLRQLINHPA